MNVSRKTYMRSAICMMAVLVGLCTIPQQASAIPANPNVIHEKQPDGTVIALHFRGDEFFHWYEDLEGFTVVRDGAIYKYADVSAQGRLVATAAVVGRDNPRNAGLRPGILPTRSAIAQQRLGIADGLERNDGVTPMITPAGTVKNIIILMRFTNHVGRTLPSNADFDVLLNAVGGDPTLAPTGSVRDAYLEMSYGILTLNSTVFGFVDLPNSEAYYANGVSGLGATGRQDEMIQDALAAADALIDFSMFDDDMDGVVDAIGFVHSGYGAEWGGTDVDGAAEADRIWSHKGGIPAQMRDGITISDYHVNPGLWGTSGTGIGRIGVICHETGHFFGMPDLYDTNGGGEGIGSYCMMANSWGFNGDQLNPPHFSAWCKTQLGWLTPTTIMPGVYAAPLAETNQTVFRIDFSGSEYLLIENRQPFGFDSTMPQGGICVWHIDEGKTNNQDEGFPGQAGWPGNNNHYKVALLQADGNYDLERGNNRGDGGDVYHGGGVSQISANTVPNTNSYQDGTNNATDVTLCVTDPSGDVMEFSYFLGADVVEPVITCPADTSVECNTSTDPAVTGFPTLSDDCDNNLTVVPSDVTTPGDCPQEYTITRTWTATDDAGNMDTCTQTIEVVDTTDPVVTQPADITIECDQPTDPSNTGTGTATDNCDTEPTVTYADEVIPGECPQEMTINRTWTATDACENTSSELQVIEVVDTTNPVITCPENITIECINPSGFPSDFVAFDATATDNCDTEVDITDDKPDYYPPTCDQDGTVITFTATDDCGNFSQCQAVVRVIGAMCCPGVTDTDLKLMVTDLDLRQDNEGPGNTKARFDIWNSNEVRFSGTERCIICWDETLISDYGPIANHLIIENLQTDKGKARIQNEASTVCPESTEAALLGVAIEETQFLGSPYVEMRSAVTLVGMGEQAARIQYDIIEEPEEANDGGLVITQLPGVGTTPNQPSLNLGNDTDLTGGVSDNRASTTFKGSLVSWPVIEVKWDAYGTLIQDTFITIANDNPGQVKIQFYQVNGDAPLDPVIDQNSMELIERGHPGWNWSDYQITLTGDESAYWSVATGLPKGVSPISVLDSGNPNGRPDLDPSNLGGRVIRGFLVGWAVNDNGQEIRWNHLKGHAVVIRYNHQTAFDYNPWNFRVVSGVPEGAQSDGDPGSLNLDGVEYDYAPESLLFDFFAAGTRALSHPAVRDQD